MVLCLYLTGAYWHDLLINKTRSHLDNAGFEVVGECHNLARDGKRYFGLFEVTHPNRENADRGTIIGLRNAHDKCFPAGLWASDASFVCDNLIFTNHKVGTLSYKEYLYADLDRYQELLVSCLTFGLGKDNRIASYQDFDLTNAQVNDLVIRSIIVQVQLARQRLSMLLTNGVK